MTHGSLDNAIDFLFDELADGPRTAKAVGEAAATAGHSAMTIRRARERLGVAVFRQGFGRGGMWCWRLPSAKDVQGARLSCSNSLDLDDLDLGGLDLDDLDLPDDLGQRLEEELRNLTFDDLSDASLDIPPTTSPSRRRGRAN